MADKEAVPMIHVTKGDLNLIYLKSEAIFTLRKETFEAIAQLLAEYPGADEELTYDVNEYIMQHIANTRKVLAEEEQQADIAAEKVAYDAEVRKPFQAEPAIDSPQEIQPEIPPY